MLFTKIGAACSQRKTLDPPLQGAHWLAGQCRFAGLQHATRSPRYSFRWDDVRGAVNLTSYEDTFIKPKTLDPGFRRDDDIEATCSLSRDDDVEANNSKSAVST